MSDPENNTKFESEEITDKVPEAKKELEDSVAKIHRFFRQSKYDERDLTNDLGILKRSRNDLVSKINTYRKYVDQKTSDSLIEIKALIDSFIRTGKKNIKLSLFALNRKGILEQSDDLFEYTKNFEVTNIATENDTTIGDIEEDTRKKIKKNTDL